LSGATRTGYKSLVAAASNVTEGWVDLSDEAATARLAGRVAREARRGDAIALSGELGAGKTSFARAFIRACGAPEEVPSPSFTLVQTYDTPRGAVSHFDLYRLSRPEEIEELGLDEALAEGIVLIEWPDRLAGFAPPDRLDIALLPGAAPEARRARLRGDRSWSARLPRILAA